MTDLTDKTIGFWHVLRRVPNHIAPNRHSRPYYLCCCKCGTTREVSANDLARGKTNSCGCKSQHKAKHANIKIPIKYHTTQTPKMSIAEFNAEAKRRGFDTYGQYQGYLTTGGKP